MSTTPVTPCPHPHLVKIENMLEGTYECETCGELVGVTFGPVPMPKVVFGTAGEKTP